MALVIEDGTVVPNASSFVTVDEYKTWAGARGYALPSDPQIEINAVKSIDYINSRENEYDGDRVDDEQELPWPRTGQYIYNVLIADDAIPKQVKEYQFAVMKALADGIDLFPTTQDRTLKRQKTGPLEKEWFDASLTPTTTYIDAAVAPLLGGSGAFALTVTRI